MDRRDIHARLDICQALRNALEWPSKRLTGPRYQSIYPQLRAGLEGPIVASARAFLHLRQVRVVRLECELG